MYVLRLWGLSDDPFELCGGNEFGFTTIPFSEDFRGRRAAKDARVDKAWKAEVWNMAAGAEDAFKVPDSFGAETTLSM